MGMTGLRNLIIGTTSMLITLALAFAIISYMGSGVEISYSGTPNTIANAQVAVNNYCNIGLSNTAINFGALYPTANDDVTNLIVANSLGNISGNIVLAGGNWILPGGAFGFFVSNTYWNPTSSVSTVPLTGNQLTLYPTNTKTLISLPVSYPTIPSNNVFFGLSVPAGIAPGSYTQNVLFYLTCGASNSVSVNATLAITVQATCYIGVSNSAISFGALNPGSSVNTANAEFVTNPGGNSNANILVEGSNWVSGGNNFFVANTLWSATSLGSYGGLPLNLAPANFVNTNIEIPYPPTSNGNNIYFGVAVPAGQASGTYTQNIIIENLC